MARGTSLVQLLTDLRAEAKLSLSPNLNIQHRDTQVNKLQRTQEWLWEDFNWPHLRVERQVPVQAGQRYYAPPAGLSIDRIEAIQFYSDGGWHGVLPGIGPGEYYAFNSDLDQRDWPIRRWQIHEGEDIEVWPIANQNQNAATLESTLKFVGIRGLNPLVDDTDTADLDDRMLVMFAAAELLSNAGSKDAQLKLDQAQKRYAKLRSGLMPRRQFRMFGTGMVGPARPYIAHYIPPVGNTFTAD